MGWTFYADNPQLSRSQMIEREFTQVQSTDNPHAYGFESMHERGSTVYTIMWRDSPGQSRVYFGMVFLTRRKNGEFGYKDVGEDCGPYAFDAPLSMLDKLDKLAPNPRGYAADWRARCRHQHATRKARRKTYAPGLCVKLGTCWTYKLQYPAGIRKGWIVLRDDGRVFRMSNAQLSKSTIV